MQDRKDYCYLCQKLHPEYWPRYATDEHHVVFGTANRNLSEKYGLKVYLCPEHHTISPEAPHRNHEVARLLQREAQETFEKRFPKLDFRKIFGWNYL